RARGGDRAAADRPVRLVWILDRAALVAVGQRRELVHRGDPRALPGGVRDRVVGKDSAPHLDERGDHQHDDRQDERELDQALAALTRTAAMAKATKTVHGALLRTVMPLLHSTV